MIFHRKQKPIQNLNISINRINMERVESLNFLGILLVADIDDTEVIWIALLRHAGKNTGSTWR